MRKIINLTLVSAALLLGACTKYVDTVVLDRQVYEDINQTEIGIKQFQHEIKFEIQRSHITSATGGGLLFALMDVAIENERMKKATEAGEPIRKAMVDYDFNKVIQTEVRGLVDETKWLRPISVDVVTDPTDSLIMTSARRGLADAYGLFFPMYSLSSDFKTVSVSLDFGLYPHSAELKELVKNTRDDNRQSPVFKMTKEIKVPLKNATDDPVENAKLWSENQGEQLKDSLELGLVDCIEALRSDLNLAMVAERRPQ